MNTKWPAGIYSGLAQTSACIDWPAGKYCAIGTSTPADCPINTKYAYQYPWPAGTYNSATLKTQISDCTPCPIGNVWEFTANDEQSSHLLLEEEDEEDEEENLCWKLKLK